MRTVKDPIAICRKTKRVGLTVGGMVTHKMILPTLSQKPATKTVYVSALQAAGELNDHIIYNIILMGMPPMEERSQQQKKNRLKCMSYNSAASGHCHLWLRLFF